MTNGANPSNPWLPFCKQDMHRKVRLFCLPYAGGAASIFRDWSAILGTEIEVCPIELPGRGTRFREKPVSDLLSLAHAVCDSILPHLDRPFVLFGHSMGALLGFEILRNLQGRFGLKPLLFFAAGRNAAHIPENKISYDLPEAALMQRLQELNGTPSGVMEHPEFKLLIMPTLRADFAISETYAYTEGPPLECPVIALGGVSDPETTVEGLDAWRQHTDSSFKLRIFPGEHFFLNSSKELMLQTMIEETNLVLAQSSQVAVGH
jgi:medium-chain acyl-[acyl-carrier-protein] hydrolase